MTILLFKYSLFFGGAEKQLLLIANSLQENGCKVSVLCRKADPVFLKRFNEGVEIYQLPVSNLMKQIFFTISIIRKNRIQIVHTWDLITALIGFVCHFSTKAVMVNGSLRSAPSEYIFAKYPKMKWQRLFARFNYYLGLPIISNSKAGFVSYKIPFDKTHTFVLYNGYIIEKKPLTEAIPNDKLIIGMLANMRWKKDFRTFIQAGIKLLEKKYNLEFILIGDGEDRSIFEEMVKDSTYPSSFIFTGHVKNPEFYVAQCDICVLTNDISGEGISNSIMEYMAYKKPVIATDMGGNPELVIDGKTGFLIEAKNIETLCERLVELIENPDLRSKMGDNGYNHLRENFSIEKMTNGIMQFYKSIV